MYDQNDKFFTSFTAKKDTKISISLDSGKTQNFDFKFQVDPPTKWSKTRFSWIFQFNPGHKQSSQERTPPLLLRAHSKCLTPLTRPLAVPIIRNEPGGGRRPKLTVRSAHAAARPNAQHINVAEQPGPGAPLLITGGLATSELVAGPTGALAGH